MMAEQRPTAEQDRLLAEWESTAASITGWTKVMFAMGAGLVLLAFAPDSLVISDSAKTEMPFIGSASIKLVLICGPLLLLLIRLYVSSYLRRWNDLKAELGDLERRQDTTLLIRNRLPQWTGLVHFPLVGVVFIISTWKGLAFPLWGEAMAVLTAGVLAWLTYGAARSGRWFVLAIMLLIIIVTPAVVTYELMGHTKNGAFDDPDEDKYRGNFFWVNCSSPVVPRPKESDENQSEEADENRSEQNHANGCIGNKDDWDISKYADDQSDLGCRAKIGAVAPLYTRFFVIRRQLHFSGAEMLRADLRHMNLRWASMTHADMSDSLFRHAKLQRARATNAVFKGADFGHARMQNIFLRRAKLQEASFWCANLEGAKLVNADLQNARIMNADLTNADLKRADMKGADLRSTKLRNAKLQKANLQKATFGRVGKPEKRDVTDLTGANLRCADLRGVDLSKTKGLTAEHLSEACMDDETRLPPELKGVRKFVPQQCKMEKRCPKNEDNRR